MQPGIDHAKAVLQTKIIAIIAIILIIAIIPKSTVQITKILGNNRH